MSKKVTEDAVLKALASLDAELGEEVIKASDDDLDQPEGADLGNPAKDKMSAAAKSKDKDKDEGDKPAFMKAEDEDEDEESEDEPAEKKPNPFAKGKAVKKSFTEDMPEEIETKIDVSEFLKSLVKHTGETIDSLTEYVVKSDKHHSGRYGELVGQVNEIQKSQAKIGLVLKAICEQIGVVKSAPARSTKSDTVAKSAAAVPERKFNSGLENEAPEEKMFKSLSEDPRIAKSQMSETLCDLVKSGHATDMDVITFESNGFIRPELVGKLKEKLN